MSSQWTAISEQQDHGWIAYFREQPQAVTPGETRGEALRNLEATASLLLSAGFGGADVSDEDAGGYLA